MLREEYGFGRLKYTRQNQAIGMEHPFGMPGLFISTSDDFKKTYRKCK